MGIDFSASRLSYEKDELIEKNIGNTPYPLFDRWIKDALAEQVKEPYAMSVATCGSDNRPSVRTVLMREVVERGDEVLLVFYTNYDSDKGQDLAQNPHAECLFFWADLERQVRISGAVQKLDEELSDAYFNSRPKDSQLAAWVSRPQSGVVDSRETMENDFVKLSAKFGENVPRPAFWGGYLLIADKIEFWQGRANRMHDRIVYKKENDKWVRERILP
ncbi:MAG: pyridoxamine 5'-phosphate oxidase [Moraxella sp.]|uniref:pyridoxamine 5'-phosphate oxidase n=1 Tax=Moraxella sp. TaxID=479 RepID=UPI0026DB9DE5|nr:pyridoxamine 5'-phosphate oxidase [Moraxella sp.]MDO4449510.1 pyridoxamine 5'-phosphate oxidase [Moraxella sp.]